MRWYSAMCVSTVPLFSWTWVLISFALSAYLSVFTVCSYCMLDPETVATITVLEFPHKPSLSILVSFESRNGTNTNPFFFRFPSALMQFASDSRLRLMFAPSLSCCPRLFVSEARSAPARSTSASFAVVYARRWWFRSDRVIQISKTAWLRELVAFAPVSSVFRRAFPCRSSSKISPSSRTLTCVSPATHGPFSGSSLSSSAGEWGTNKSYTSSLYTSVYEHSTPWSAPSSSRSSAIIRNASRRLSTIRPGSTWSPTIVCVFPEPVAPYANTVALIPRRTPRTSGATVSRYTVSLLASPSNAASKTYRRSFLRTPPATTELAEEEEVPRGAAPIRVGSFACSSSSGSMTQTHRLSTSFVTVRAPPRRSFLERGRARTATRNVAWETPLRCNTRVNLCEASTSSAISSSVAAA